MKIRALISSAVLTAMLFSMTVAYAAKGSLPEITPITHTVSIASASSVYVDEGMPTANYNVLSEQFLSVGRDEFGYERQSLIRFHPIKKADGGLLPDDAKITAAHVRIYKTGSEAGTIKFYRLSGSFNESTVTWNTKPVVSSTTAVASAAIPSEAGWYNVTIPLSLVDAWLSSSALNRGIAIRPDWTDAGKSITFRSDESANYPPALVISYTGSAPDSPSTPPDTSDNTPCTLTYSVSPENPMPGEPMTITARATDNKALSHVTIMRGTTQLARQEAAGTQTELSVSYTETAALPSMSYTLIADDKADPLPVRKDITVPVTGSASAPVVRITAEWLDVETTVPERYRFIAGDGQRVRLTATASDPDGIKHLTISLNGILHDYTYSGETSVSETLTWTNNELAGNRFSYYASATDGENLYASTSPESFDIAGVDDITLLWSSAPSFANEGVTTLPWDTMVQIFGTDECYWDKDRGWKDPGAELYYDTKIRDCADGGTCLGMSTLAAELSTGRIAASDIEYPYSAWQLRRANSYTGEYIIARQGAFYSDSIQEEYFAQDNEADDADIWIQVLERIEGGLERNRPGVIAIYEGSGGHALVPWMVRHMDDGSVRVYVYDCNKVSGIHNADADINNSNQYPYIEMGPTGRDGWCYAFNSASTWNDNLFYFPYEALLGNYPRLNKMGGAANAPYITDHTIFNWVGGTTASLAGSADLYFEDDQGRVTGIKNGQLREEIPGSMAVLPVMGGSFTDHEMYLLPGNVRLSAVVSGTAQGEYALAMLNGVSTYAIQGKSIRTGKSDRLVMEPVSGGSRYKLILKSGSADNDFTIRLSTEIPGKVKKLDADFIGREFIFEKAGMGEGKEIATSLDSDASGVIVETATGGIIFDTILRSTESADTAGSSQTDIPGSRRARITPETKKTVKLTPEDWATGETDGTVTVEETGSSSSAASAWAVPEIEQAKAYGLTTDEILSDFQKNITRSEFCEISVLLYEKLTGRTALPVSPNPFTDTSHTEILKAYNLGIVKGVSADRFAPDQPTTRQEICVMLTRALKAAIPAINTEVANPAAFADENKIAAWAIDAVRFMNSKGIMKGVGSNTINPLGNTTREQAIALVKRTYDAFK
jgi:hypothetical protein